MPPSRHPKSAEVIKQKSDKEMMDLLLKLNEILNVTEQELEKTLQSRQSESTSQPQNVVPMVSIAVPSTLATALAPNVPLATTKAIAVTGTGIGTTQVGTSSQSIEELMKSMEKMKLQVLNCKR